MLDTGRDTAAVITDPRGAFAVLSAAADGVDVTIERVDYDAAAVAAEIREVGLPGEFADKLLPAT
jgi:limonene-1,2-epoxide hydrolase